MKHPEKREQREKGQKHTQRKGKQIVCTKMRRINTLVHMFANVFTFIHRVWWLGCYKNNMKIHLFYWKSAQSYKGKKPKRNGRRVDLLGLQAFALWLCGQVQFVPIAFLAERFMYTRFSLFSFPFTHRKSCRAVESGQCYKSDIAVQANNARLQWGGIMQHYKGLAGYCHAVVRNAGIYATARGIFGWVVPRLASTAQSPRCSATLQSCTLIFSQGPGHSIERVEQECVCACATFLPLVFMYSHFSHTHYNTYRHTHTVTALLASYSLIKLHVPTLFSIFDYRTQRSPGYEWSLAGKTTPELYMQEHEPALLRLQAKLSLRAGRQCLILPPTHTPKHKHIHTLLISITSV